jgi:hypothetical protein
MLNQFRGDGAPVAGEIFFERSLLRVLRLRAVGRRRDTSPVPRARRGPSVRGANLVILPHVLDPKHS